MSNVPAQSLHALADRINEEHRLCGQAIMTGLEHARNAGELLVAAKAKIRHGQWLSWLAENVRFSERTAQAYMRVANGWAELKGKAQATADLTLEDGLRLLARPAAIENVAPPDWYDIYRVAISDVLDCLRKRMANPGITCAELVVVRKVAEEIRQLAAELDVRFGTILGQLLQQPEGPLDDSVAQDIAEDDDKARTRCATSLGTMISILKQNAA